MLTQTGGEHRRGLFLALESFAGTAALLLDASGNLEYGNRQACELLDCAGDDLLRSRWKSIGPLFALPPQLPASSKPHLFSADVPLAAGSRRLNLELHVLDECAGHGHFALLKDRGAFDPVERELFLASERRGWGHQSDTLLHDLKGIMNSMQISLELLANPDGEMASMSPEEARQQRRIATIKADLARMTQALRALPGADGGGEPVATDFDARDVVREIFATLRQLVRRNNVELKLDLPDSALPVRGRRAWLKQALFNVALHRLNAMRAGGRLLVEAQATQQGMVVQLSNDVPDMRDGKGAESQRFFCLRQISGATDLRVARAVFESQGGAMEIVNGDGDSTVFVMRLPR